MLESKTKEGSYAHTRVDYKAGYFTYYRIINQYLRYY